MSSVVEIEAVLPKLSTEELQQIERALHQQYRERHSGIIYDDSYGVVTEADMMAAADEAFLEYDKTEREGKSQTR
jgi:hypothetical protein